MDNAEVLDKWRARAKNIQNCHYDTAAELKFLHYVTGVPLVILSAISASNLLAEVSNVSLFQPYSKLTAVLISLLVTILASIQTFLGFEKRSDLHYKAGRKYGAMKRKIELMSGPDEAKLAELSTEWSALTEESPIIPIGVWRRNERKKSSVPDLTHAGGVVARRKDATVQYLLVQARDEPHEWVLPKGHIEKGESMEQAARREVFEETGVEAAVRDVLDTVEFSDKKGRVKAQFFLMEAVGEGSSPEGRERKWLCFEDCMRELRYKEARRVVSQAHASLWRTTETRRETPPAHPSLSS